MIRREEMQDKYGKSTTCMYMGSVRVWRDIGLQNFQRHVGKPMEAGTQSDASISQKLTTDMFAMEHDQVRDRKSMRYPATVIVPLDEERKLLEAPK